jgi:hypothetical protein
MNIGQRVAGGFMGALFLGMLLGAVIMPVQAGDASVQLTNGKHPLSRGVQHRVPQAGRPLYAPPVFMDRSTPIGERPFAKPFTDRGPSIADRPLAPIGGGAQVAPGPVPSVWCQGEWVRLDSPGHRCPSH